MDLDKQAALAAIEEQSAVFTALSDAIWDAPELSLKEVRAAALYGKTLRELGFAVTEKLGGIDTAFCGSFGSGRPVIGILGEFDALSGLSQRAGAAERCPVTPGGSGHGCGHNLLGAGSLAAAVGVKRYLERSGASGTVIFFGCPGEEGGAAKAFLARAGLWKELDAALSWHPGDANQTVTGTNNSCIQVLYRFTGVAAHAAGEPHRGRSALDAVELMNIGAQFLREHMTSDCRIHYAITDAGGVSPNVVQAEASVLYMVRAGKVADSVALQKRVDDIARGAALMTGTSFTRVFIDGTADLLPNFTLERVLYDNMEALGAPECPEEDRALYAALKATLPPDAAGYGTGAACDGAIRRRVGELSDGGKRPVNDFLMPRFSGEVFRSGSSDVGDVSQLTPTGQINAAVWPSGAAGHSWQIVACGKSALAHRGLLFAGKTLALTAIDLLTRPELLREAKEEFAARGGGQYVCPIEPDAVPIAL